jgi:hypothetical protein
MKKVLMIMVVMIGFSGCFGMPQQLIECKQPQKVGDKIFCEK